MKIFIMMLLASWFHWFIAQHYTTKRIQKQAIDQGCAYYSPIDGQFKWGLYEIGIL